MKENYNRLTEDRIFSVEKHILKCQKCPRLIRINPYPMPHIFYQDTEENDLRLPFMIIGRNPGTEDIYKKVSENNFMKIYHHNFYHCKFARYFRNIISSEIFTEKFFFTNICKCPTPNNSPLIDREIENCRIYLKRQISIIRPKIIFTLGNDSLRWFEPLLSLARVFGEELYFNTETKIIPLYHPSYLSRDFPKKKQKQKAIIKEIVNDYHI